MKFIIRYIIIAGALYIIGQIIPGVSFVTLIAVAIVAAAILIFDTLIEPILAILTLPINLLTLGLFSVIINAALFYFLSLIIPNFSVAGFIPAILGSIIIFAIDHLVKKLV